jgi:hypothetical protein
MRARDGGAQPVRGQRAGHPAAQLGELGHRVADPAVHAGGDLHHRGVRLQRHAVAQLARQRGMHLVSAERQRPAVGVEEHELLLDADRHLAAGRTPAPGSPSWDIGHDGTR